MQPLLPDPEMPLHLRIDAYRREHRITIAELAWRAGVSTNTAARCLHGFDVRLSTLMCLAGALGLDVHVQPTSPTSIA